MLKTIKFSDLLQWDAKQFYFTKIKSKFKLEKLGLHIKHETKKYILNNEPEKKYVLLGVSNKNGMFDADELYGKEINQKYHKVENNWLAYNPYRINVGSIGLKTSGLKGEYISPAYVVFSCKETVLPEYIYFLIKTDTFNKIINDSTTGTVRQTLHFDKLAEIEVPIPTIKQQEEILKEYKATLAEIEKLKENLHIIERKKDTYLVDNLNLIDDFGILEDKNEKSNILKIKKYSSLINWDAKGFEYNSADLFKSKKFKNTNIFDVCKFNPTTKIDVDDNDEVSFIPMDLVSGINGEVEKIETKKVKLAKGYTKFKDNDIIWAKITPCMQNGKCAILKNLKNHYGFGSTEFNVFRCNSDLLPEYLYIFLRSKRLRKMALNYLTGTAGQQRVSKKFFEDLRIPLINISDKNSDNVSQEKIVTVYNQYNDKMKDIYKKIGDLSKKASLNFELNVYK